MRSTAAWAFVAALLFSLLPPSSPALAVAAPTIAVTPSQFSPNGDGDRDSTVIVVTLTEPAKQQVRVLDLSGNVKGYVKRFGAVQPAGTYRYSFSGKLSGPGGTVVTLGEGTYQAEAATQGGDGSTARARTPFFINNTLRNPTVYSPAYEYPGGQSTLFSPNGDTRKDGLDAFFELSRPAKVTMRLYTGGRQVRVFAASFSSRNAFGTISGELSWNGKIMRNGAWVWAPAGAYWVTLEATPLDTATAARLGVAYSARQAMADKTRPSASGALSRSTIYTAQGQSATLSYTLGERGYRRVEVLNAAGSVVSVSDWAATGTQGAYKWAGLNDERMPLPSGTYRVRLYAQDGAGNPAASYPLTFSVKLVRSTVASGRAAWTPWSGYWWPFLNTYATKLYNVPGPLTRYDKATGSASKAWEYRLEPNGGHRVTDPDLDWFGHCQAWSAAAIMERQPYGKTYNGVTFSQDDVEGLYSETWVHHDGAFYGTRFSPGMSRTDEAYKDVYPADFDSLVRYWIGDMDTPLLMDLTTGVEVWNYPVYAFSRTSTRSGAKEYVRMTVTRAAPKFRYSGTSSVTHTFYYTLQPGTKGVWSNPSGSSVDTHPDYVVKVDGRTEDYGNPEVKPSKLNEMFRATGRAVTPEGGAPVETAQQGASIPNSLGWRVGTEWTVKARKYATYLAQPAWISTTYRYTVVSADPSARSFVVAVRYADPSLQPESARGDLLRATYTAVDGRLRLLSVQPQGKGPQLAPVAAKEVLGRSALSLEVATSPLTGGTRVAARAPRLGAVQANRVLLAPGETATYAKGVPWWLSYSKGSDLQATLTGFKP